MPLLRFSGLGAEASDLEPTGDSPAAGRVLDLDGGTEQVPERPESPKQWKAKAGVNLRKSLAWDNTFFTSEDQVVDASNKLHISCLPLIELEAQQLCKELRNIFEMLGRSSNGKEINELKMDKENTSSILLAMG